MSVQKPGLVRKRFWLVLALVAALVATALWFGLKAAYADSATLRARWIITQWRDGKGPARQPEVVVRVGADLLTGTRITPGNAGLYDDLGFLYAFQAEALAPFAADPALGQYQRSLLTQALGHYRTSTTLRPTFPYSWAYLALAKQMLAEQDSEFWLAFDNAYRLGKAEAGVQMPVALMAFRAWPSLSDERKARVVTMVQTAQPKVAENLRAMASSLSVTLQP